MQQQVAGYAAAPLPATFTAWRLLDMDDTAIERFLRGYLPGIERREAPEKANALVHQAAVQVAHARIGILKSAMGVNG